MLSHSILLTRSQRASFTRLTHTNASRSCMRCVKHMENLRCRCSRCQGTQRWLQDPHVLLTAAKQQISSRASLQQGSSSSPLQMTSLKCLLPTHAFATPYSLVTSQGPGEISKGTGGAVQSEKGLGKAEGNALFLRWVLGNGVLDKRHATGRRGGIGTQRKIQACRKPSLSPSQLLGCFRGGMEAGGRGPATANTPHPSYMENVPWTGGLTKETVSGFQWDSLPQTQPNCGRALGPAADALAGCPATWG